MEFESDNYITKTSQPKMVIYEDLRIVLYGLRKAP